MPYVADPTNDNQPTEDVSLETAAAEFRALKRYIRQDLLGLVTAQQAATLDAAERALAAYARAEALTGYAGDWSTRAGAATPPMSVSHAGSLWYLSAPLANIAAAEPGVDAVWKSVATNSTQITHEASTVAAALNAGSAALAAYKASGRHAEHLNKLLNPNFMLVNRGLSFTGITAAGRKVMDCWTCTVSAGAAVATVDRSTLTPNAALHPYSARVLITTAKATLAADDFIIFSQIIEGYDVVSLVGQPVALAFNVYSSVPGTYHVALRNSGLDRAYVKSFQITAANTWQKISILLPDGLPNTGTWNFGDGIGLYVDICLASGSTLQAPADGVWNTTNYISGAGQVNLAAAVNNVFHVTGMQLVQEDEVGPFPVRALSQETHLVYRYVRPNPPGVGITSTTTNLAGTTMTLHPPMRTPITATLLTGTNRVLEAAVAFRTLTAVNAVSLEPSGGYLDVTISASTANKMHTLLPGAVLFDSSL